MDQELIGDVTPDLTEQEIVNLTCGQVVFGHFFGEITERSKTVIFPPTAEVAITEEMNKAERVLESIKISADKCKERTPESLKDLIEKAVNTLKEKEFYDPNLGESDQNGSCKEGLISVFIIIEQIKTYYNKLEPLKKELLTILSNGYRHTVGGRELTQQEIDEQIGEVNGLFLGIILSVDLMKSELEKL